MAPSLDYMHRAWLDALNDGWTKKPIVEMLIPSTLDPTLAPKGKHVASLFCQHFRYDLGPGRSWDKEREKAADAVIALVDSHAPGFAKSVLGRQIHSPLDLERRFGLIGGDIFHGKMGLDQLFSARPMIGAADYRMPLKGLYLCGSGAHPGGGVTGAPGHNAARAVLADRQLLEARRGEAARRDQGARPQPGAGRAVVHAIAGRSGRRGDQDRAPGSRRRHPPLGAAVARRGRCAASPLISSAATAARNRRRSTFARPEGAELVRRLALESDVVVENFKVGGLTKFGLDAASRCAPPTRAWSMPRSPASGRTGPMPTRAGYDYIIQGMGGLMSITGLPDGEPGGGPMRVGVAVADLFTGLYTTVSILAALVPARTDRARARISTWRCSTRQLAMLANQASNALVSGKDPPRQGITHPNIVPYQPFDAADQPIIIAIGNERQFERLAAICGHPEWADDPRFADNAARVANRARLIALIADVIATRPAAEWLEQLEAAGIPGRADQPHQPGAGRRPGAAPRDGAHDCRRAAGRLAGPARRRARRQRPAAARAGRAYGRRY